mgnify:CR=1 FL=1
MLTNTEKQINVSFMNTSEAFLASINESIANAEKIANSIPKKGLNVYLDKSTMVMQTFSDPSAFEFAKQATARKGQSSILRMQMDGAGRTQAKAL